jgi:hypothetical protein
MQAPMLPCADYGMELVARRLAAFRSGPGESVWDARAGIPGAKISAARSLAVVVKKSCRKFLRLDQGQERATTRRLRSQTPGTPMTDREKIIAVLREKPLKAFEIMKRVNIRNQEDCQSLLLKMRDEGTVKFDIHKGHWLAA